ncbi:MAG: endoglucanase A [Armatimonadetes bacterium]|nr:endoglucanase A [Armatimonadota bacterium]
MWNTLLLIAVQVVHQFDVKVDERATQPISPYIYGANQPDWDKAQVPYPLVRQGGNRMTAYNWETNASNAGNDWHMQNDNYLGESNEPGWTLKNFFEPAQNRKAAVILTVPCAGYVSADKNGDGDVNKTPDYIHKRFLPSKPAKPGAYRFPPDTKDRVVYQDEMVAWVEKTKSPATPVWYSLDNEPDLWHSTHVRLWPLPVKYADILGIGVDYAAAIKKAAPKTLVFGPANYGWQGFRVFQDAPDGQGRDFLDFYLGGMRAAESKAGKRLLDVLDVHWYPEAQGEGKRITTDTPGGKELVDARMQAPRSLWDPTYVEKSWITDSLGKKPIVLLEYLKTRVDRSYPGTKMAITEYNYGGGKEFSGMVAQADVLGIFGSRGLFAACNWGVDSNSPAQLAGFLAYLDFDGKGAKFGDVSARATMSHPVGGSIDPKLAAAYASRDSKNPKRWVFVLINRSENSGSFKLPYGGQTRAFQADAAHPHSPKAVQVLVKEGVPMVMTSRGTVTTVEIIRP